MNGLKLKQIVWNFEQWLKTQQMFHLLTQNMIKANKFFVCLHGDKTYNSFVCGNTT
jgi:hypothetical protein